MYIVHARLFSFRENAVRHRIGQGVVSLENSRSNRKYIPIRCFYEI